MLSLLTVVCENSLGLMVLMDRPRISTTSIAELTVSILQRRKRGPEETKTHSVFTVKALGEEPKHLTLESVCPGWECWLRRTH